MKLSTSLQQAAAATFDAVAFVEKFWDGKLLSATEMATDAAGLLKEMQIHPEATQKKYGRSAGLGSTYCYFVRGTGRVVSLEKHGVALAVSTEGTVAEVVLETGPIFGNAVRDGTGLLNVSDFANSQDFNALSSEINKRVEEHVLPKLKGVAVGATVKFSGCAEVTEEGDLRPLRLVPLAVELR